VRDSIAFKGECGTHKPTNIINKIPKKMGNKVKEKSHG